MSIAVVSFFFSSKFGWLTRVLCWSLKSRVGAGALPGGGCRDRVYEKSGHFVEVVRGCCVMLVLRSSWCFFSHSYSRSGALVANLSPSRRVAMCASCFVN